MTRIVNIVRRWYEVDCDPGNGTDLFLLDFHNVPFEHWAEGKLEAYLGQLESRDRSKDCRSKLGFSNEYFRVIAIKRVLTSRRLRKQNGQT